MNWGGKKSANEGVFQTASSLRVVLRTKVEGKTPGINFDSRFQDSLDEERITSETTFFSYKTM